MNICFVYRRYPIADNEKSTGLGNYIYHLAQRLSHKHPVFILTQSDKFHIRRQKNIIIYSYDNKYYFFQKKILQYLIDNIKATYALLRLNSKYRFDIVEFANWKTEGYLFALICLILSIRIKIVCRIHTGALDVETHNKKVTLSIRIIHRIEQLFVNLPNVYLTTSTRAHAKRYRKLYCLKNKQIHIIPLGLPLPLSFHRKRLSVKNGANILFVGRIEARKGIQTLIQSINLVFEKYPKAILYIIGKGNIDVFSLIHRFVAIRFLPRVRYLGYIQSNTRMKHFYQISDICVFPSLYESFGLTILEAMSHGKPVISTKVGGIPEIITHESNGLLIPPNNSKILSKTICTLLPDAALRKKLGYNARETVKNKFSLSRLFKETESFYSNIQ